jgi:hypothetical protein
MKDRLAFQIEDRLLKVKDCSVCTIDLVGWCERWSISTTSQDRCFDILEAF